jgi:DNA-directed RNA polymerase specialized sigma subunit
MSSDAIGRRSCPWRLSTSRTISPTHCPKLPDRQRSALVLRYYEGLTEAEIAEALGCRRGTVKSATSRALEQLRKVIEP